MTAVPPRNADELASAGAYGWWRYGATFALCATTSLIALALQSLFDASNIVMLFLLSVVGVSFALGRGPAVLAAVVNVLAFDWLFVPPRFTFVVDDAQYLLTFAVMLIVGLVVGQLTARLRREATASARSGAHVPPSFRNDP